MKTKNAIIAIAALAASMLALCPKKAVETVKKFFNGK